MINRKKVNFMKLSIVLQRDNAEMNNNDKEFLRMFCKHSDGLSDNFMKLFEDMFIYVSKKAASNKKKYFQNAYIYIIIVAIIEVVAVIAAISQNYTNTIWNIILIVCNTIIALLLVVKGIYDSIKNTKKHGETWIRYTIHRDELKFEMVKYMENVDNYANISKEKKRSEFKSAVMKIEERNVKRFEENMKGIV